jgi:hypothetical protein
MTSWLVGPLLEEEAPSSVPVGPFKPISHSELLVSTAYRSLYLTGIRSALFNFHSRL